MTIKKKKIPSILIILMVILLIFKSSQGIIFVTAQVGVKTDVLYISDSQGKTLAGLQLDTDTINVTTQTTSQIDLTNLNNFDVVVLNDANLSLSDLSTLYTWTEGANHGLFIIMGKNLTIGNELLNTFGFTTETQFQNNSGDVTDNDEFNKLKGISVYNSSLTSHAILNSIVWNTAPEIFYWTKVANVIEENVTTYVKMTWNDADLNTADANSNIEYPMMAGVNIGNKEGDNVFLLTGWLQEEFETIESNVHFMVWPFFNYLLFVTAQSCAGVSEIPVYGSWGFSPVPHFFEQIILGVLVVLTAIASLWFFIRARKEKDTPKDYFGKDDISAIQTTSDEEITVDKQVTEDEDILVDKTDEWEAVGFHRQLSGFLKLYFLIMILIIPQLLVTSMIMPQFINPYPQSSGWYSYTLHFFEAIWLIFDLGFNYAIIKFFAQHRLERPEKAFHYVQLFIWWEVLSGVIQITFFAFIGSFLFPLTQFNYLSWMFIVHSLIQFPGIFLVFQYFFQSIQRSDYQMLAYVLQAFLLRLILQVITVPICKMIFEGNVMYGAAFGTSVGLLVGQLLGDWCLFYITLKMYKSLKLSLKPVFAADFTKEEFWETFKFGMKMAGGEVFVPLVWLLQVFLVVEFIPNSSQEQGYFELAWTISQIPMAMTLMTSGLLGALTEAHTYKKKNLLNYNTISGFRWGFVWTFYLCATFLAIGETFIIGASGPLWIRAAQLLPLFIFMRMLGPPSWQADQEFPAADKPIYATIGWIVEQGLRAGLMVIFIIQFKNMEAVLWAYIISLTVKDILVIIMVRKKIHKWDWNIWITLIAPILSGVSIYVVFKGLDILIVSLVGGQDIISAFILLLVALFLGEFLHSFLYAFFGGYDDNTISELDRATKMVTGVKKLARFYYKSAVLGAKISPLHNKFKIEIFEAAQKEADELTAIKKRIV
ncbi:MAG: lipopolysaccharide biosynthesis protein [archaeon]|nr:lipopolysaccharide biosynthesis protein [archaeon]